jgi:hypothetical protein
VSLLVWALPFYVTGMGGLAGSQTTPGIALRVTESHKPHHHDKVETPLGGPSLYTARKFINALTRVRHYSYAKPDKST